jgi:hypothetical protein
VEFVKFISNKENIVLKDAVPLIQSIYVSAHSWNIGDSIAKVYEEKRLYAFNLLKDCIDNGCIIGNIIRDYIYDREGNIIGYDPVTGEPIVYIMDTESYVNIRSALTYVAKELQDVSPMPYELLKLVTGNNVDSNETSKVANNESINPTSQIEIRKDKEVSEDGDEEDIEGQDFSAPLTAKERQKLNMLTLQKDTLDITIEASVNVGLYYASLQEGVTFDKEILYEKLREWKYSSVTDRSINLIYRVLPPEHKRKSGDKKNK